jgi:SAM-dependent methyltransferase
MTSGDTDGSPLHFCAVLHALSTTHKKSAGRARRSMLKAIVCTEGGARSGTACNSGATLRLDSAMTITDRARATIYNRAIVGLTAGWYRAVLERLPSRCRLLDIGIGTGSALMANAALLATKDLHVTGIDIDRAYVERCRTEVVAHGVQNRIDARLESVYDHRGGPYGAAYFSASFMLLPDPPGALRHVRSLLLPGSRIYFTQTFEHQPSRLVEWIKPMLRLVTTIDFGRVTYEADFRRALAAGGVTIEEFINLDNGARRSSVLAVAAA